MSPCLSYIRHMKNAARRLAALAALCDALLPALPSSDPASHAAIPVRILELIAGAKAEDRERFEQLLDLMASPLLGFTWLGPLRSADRLSPSQRETLLRRWAASPIPDLRNAFNSLRKLTALLFYGDVQPTQQPSNPATQQLNNPHWHALGYEPLSQHAPPDPAPLPLWQPRPNEPMDCDVLVIGSGSGGSVVAAHLAAQGLDVVVVEKGPYAPTHEFTQHELPTLRRHFEASGLLTSHSGSITVLAGSTLGGGSTINWAGALRTPDFVLHEWATQHSNHHFLEKTYLEGFDFVEKRNSVSADFRHNPQNEALLQAAQNLGHRVGNIPMNLRFPPELPPELAWKATGFSCYGDAFGIKQGGAQTFLHDAAQCGARLLPNTVVERILTKNGAVAGAELSVEGRAATCQAKRVVVCAGALHTPVLLLKSGLRHPHIGRHLYLHPVAATGAFHQEEMCAWYGPMMSVIVREFEQLDGNWGFRIECPPLHPGLAAFALSWDGGEAFHRDMARLRHLAVNICLVRDRFGGRVEVGKKSGQPLIRYELHPYDRRHLLRAMQESVRMHTAARAREVRVMHNQPERFLPEKHDLEAFLKKIAAKNWAPNRFGLFSAHQMGTCRMGGNAADYPVKPNGETREVRNLFVADASLFPSASGTNPMLSVQALAYHVARGMV